MSSNYFLGKRGQSFGPYSAEQIQEMRATGKMENYSWIWDPRNSEWKPLDPPPPPLVLKAGPAISVAEGSVEAICHNFRSIAAGSIAQVRESGCIFVSQTHPEFGFPSRIVLSLLDQRSGKSQTVNGTVIGVSRGKKENWLYEISWPNCPELFTEQAAAS